MKMAAFEKFFVNSPSHTRAVATRATELLNRIDHVSGWKYLDVGCGVGAADRAIAATSGMDVTGIDLDPKQIGVATSQGAPPNLHFRVMDATRLEFSDSQFDVVAASMVTHHTPNWERVFREMVRVLRAGGYLIYGDFVFRPWLAAVGRRLIPFAGFPSADAVNSLAATAGLVKIYERRRFRQADTIWQKRPY
jgi:ubiquinone/menaquinone biosynthesis C-methylase UbiE